MKKEHIYMYPKLSETDWNLFRLGGAGLGNILFTYARAVVYAAKDDRVKLIWPTWPSVKIGPILRNEKDKRFYLDLFRNNSKYICGIKKVLLRLCKKKVTEEQYRDAVDSCGKIVELVGFEGCFDSILQDSKIVKEDLVRNLAPKNKKAIEFRADNAICMHVRLGDFKRATMEQVLSGQNDASIPVEWYALILENIRKITGTCTKTYVFSDGSDEELTPLLSMENVERITFGTAIGDILAISNAGIFVASGSSFSMWARYLGRMTTIMLPNQVKQHILLETETNKEIEALESIPTQYEDLIRRILTQ